jgi:hypothetical protein
MTVNDYAQLFLLCMFLYATAHFIMGMREKKRYEMKKKKDAAIKEAQETTDNTTP